MGASEKEKVLIEIHVDCEHCFFEGDIKVTTIGKAEFSKWFCPSCGNELQEGE